MHPILFSIGDRPISAYGFLIAVALLLGWSLSLRFARSDKLPADQLGNCYVLSVGGGLVAARLMWITQHPEAGGLSAMLDLDGSGFAGFGGVLAGLIIAGVFCQNRNIPTWAWLDCAAPAFLIGVVLERVAAFLAGVDFGHYVDPDFIFAVSFPAQLDMGAGEGAELGWTQVYTVHRSELSGLRTSADLSLPVHPSQLYAAVAAAIGAGLSFWVRARRKYSGQIALFGLGFYGAVRYLIEDSFRYDMTPDVVGPVSLGQTAGLAIVAAAIAAHLSRLQKVETDPASVIQWTGGPWTPGAEDDKKKSGKKKSGKKKSGKKKSSKKKSADESSSETSKSSDTSGSVKSSSKTKKPDKGES